MKINVEQIEASNEWSNNSIIHWIQIDINKIAKSSIQRPYALDPG